MTSFNIARSIRKYLRETLRGLLLEEYSTEELVKMGMVVGNKFNRQAGVVIDYSFCWLVSIGNNVTLAPDVRILAHDASTKRWLDYTRIGKVSIGDNVFIGAGSIVLPGVTIGDNLVIGAGSVVTKDIPPNTLALGSPAKEIMPLTSFIERHENNMKHCPIFDDSRMAANKISIEQKKEISKILEKTDGYVV